MHGIFKEILKAGEEGQSFLTVGDAANTLSEPLFLDQLGIQDKKLNYTIHSIKVYTNSVNFDLHEPRAIKGNRVKRIPDKIRTGIHADFVDFEVVIKYPYVNYGAKVAMQLANLNLSMDIDLLAYQCNPHPWNRFLSWCGCSFETFYDMLVMKFDDFIFSRIGNIVLHRIDVTFEAPSNKTLGTNITVTPVTFKDLKAVEYESKFWKRIHSFMLHTGLQISGFNNGIGTGFNRLLRAVFRSLFQLYVEDKKHLFSSVCTTSINCVARPHVDDSMYWETEEEKGKPKEEEKEKAEG